MKQILRNKINKRKIFYLLVLAFVFSIFIALAYINVQLKKQNALLNIYLSPIEFNPGEYPIIENGISPEISAQGAIVIDMDSQVPLYEKNSTLRFPPASTTKIMTALVALEHYNPSDILTIYKKDPEGVDLGFIVGEQLTFENLVYAMMLPSSNDATFAIAGNYPGGEAAFVEKMNEKATELNLTNTYFEEPVGLLDEKDYSTPVDLARLTTIALQNAEFAKIVSTKEKTITNTTGKAYKLESLNILLGTRGINGVKTGFTEGAGQVLVTSKKLESERELIFVVMQSLDRFGDTELLLNYLEGINFLSIRE